MNCSGHCRATRGKACPETVHRTVSQPPPPLPRRLLTASSYYKSDKKEDPSRILFLVGVTRFELAASASLRRRSSQTEPHPETLAFSQRKSYSTTHSDQSQGYFEIYDHRSKAFCYPSFRSGVILYNPVTTVDVL